MALLICCWAACAFCGEGLATRAAAAEDADATLEDTTLALDVATGLPATVTPDDCSADAVTLLDLESKSLVEMTLELVAAVEGPGVGLVLVADAVLDIPTDSEPPAIAVELIADDDAVVTKLEL